MHKRPLGCLTIPGIITGVLVILIVVVIGLVFGGRLFSPGILNAQAGALVGGVTSHADLSGKCSSCHAYFWQSATMEDRCLACHTDVAAQLGDPTTLHGDQSKKRPGLTCRACHPEHRGSSASLVDLTKADFSHDAFGFALSAHPKQADGSPFTCRTCHVSGFTVFDPAVCAACHQQLKADFMPAHILAYGQGCLACHDGVDTYGHSFNHDTAAFKLTGKHAQVDCYGCHTGARSISDLQATSQDCVSCHARDDAHQGQLGTDCGACHTPDGWTPASFDHAKSKFPLTGAHATLECTQCHLNNVFLPLNVACYSCHARDDAHNGQFGTQCEICHATTAWLPPTFDHTSSGFPLTGAHTDLECSECHLDNDFTNLDPACYSCHAKDDAHDGEFGTQCDTCHTTTAWLPATFDHSNTGFPLTGAHTDLKCSECHQDNVFTNLDPACYSCHAKDDAHDGQFGTDCGQCHTTTAWLPATFDHAKTGFTLTGAHNGLACNQCHTGGVFTGLSTACAACHPDPAFHVGLFAGMTCDQCHNTSAWSPAQFNANHPSACGEVTCVNHERATCRDCHNTNLMTATCLKCHDSNNPGEGNGGGGDD